jgi:hypothetical protein
VSVLLLNPTVAASNLRRAPAPRLETLDGKVLGLYANTKTNANTLLDAVAAVIAERFAIAGVVRRSEMENGVGSDGPYDFLAARCDAVITAVGDCGSCSARSTQDAAEIERRGVAAVSLCTKPFVPVARSMARMQGFGDALFVEIEHPVSSLDATGVADRAGLVVSEILDVLGVRVAGESSLALQMESLIATSPVAELDNAP